MKKLSRLLFAGALSLFLGTSVSGIQAASHDGYMAEGRFDGEGSGGGIYGPYSSGSGDADYRGGSCYAPGNDAYGSCYDAPRNDCCSRFAVGVDFLYWDVCQTGLDVAKKTTGITATSSEPCTTCSAWCSSETEFFKFKPKAGYRIGASYQLPCWDDVSLNFVFTYFHPKVNKRFHNNPGTPCETSIIQATTDQVNVGQSPIVGCQVTDPAVFLFNSPDSAVHTRVKLKYELYDLVLSKNFGCDCWTATPYIGARVLWLRESLQNDIEGSYLVTPTSAPVAGGHGYTWKAKIPAAGITFGVHGRYCFCGPLNVIGHLGVSVLGGKAKSHDNYRSFTSLDCSRLRNRGHHCQVVTGWDGSLGLGYDWNFCTCPVRLGVGYEIQDWFNLPERVRYVNKNTIDGAPISTIQTSDGAGRMTVHGLFVRVAFAF